MLKFRMIPLKAGNPQEARDAADYVLDTARARRGRCDDGTWAAVEHFHMHEHEVVDGEKLARAYLEKMRPAWDAHVVRNLDGGYFMGAWCSQGGTDIAKNEVGGRLYWALHRAGVWRADVLTMPVYGLLKLPYVGPLGVKELLRALGRSEEELNNKRHAPTFPYDTYSDDKLEKALKHNSKQVSIYTERVGKILAEQARRRVEEEDGKDT